MRPLTKGIPSEYSAQQKKTIRLKPGCKAMLLWNVSDDLRNGTSGTFLEQAGEHLMVHFPETGKVGLKRET